MSEATSPNLTRTHSAFFYGTLMHPKILRRVIGHAGARLELCPAVLMDHTRHHVIDADYPAVLPYEKSKQMFGDRELSPEEKSVRGTLVLGLTEMDIQYLDVFEGNEYVRTPVKVHRLGPLFPLSSDPSTSTSTSTSASASTFVPSTPPPLPSPENLTPPIDAEIYIWCAPLEDLEARLWDFGTFVRDNAHKWVGEGEGEVGNGEYGEVDRRREMGGNIVRGAGEA